MVQREDLTPSRGGGLQTLEQRSSEPKDCSDHPCPFASEQCPVGVSNTRPKKPPGRHDEEGEPEQHRDARHGPDEEVHLRQRGRREE